MCSSEGNACFSAFQWELRAPPPVAHSFLSMKCCCPKLKLPSGQCCPCFHCPKKAARALDIVDGSRPLSQLDLHCKLACGQVQGSTYELSHRGLQLSCSGPGLAGSGILRGCRSDEMGRI